MAKILIAHDEPNFVAGLVALLKFNAHEVACVSSIKQALRYAQAYVVDLTILDLMMSDGCGLTYFYNKWLHPKAGIVLTADPQYASRVAFDINNSNVHLLPKPLDIRRMLQLCERATQQGLTGNLHTVDSNLVPMPTAPPALVY